MGRQVGAPLGSRPVLGRTLATALPRQDCVVSSKGQIVTLDKTMGLRLLVNF
jgi:hypothetical protein